MNLLLVSIFVQFLYFLSTFTAASSNPSQSAGDVSINCGSTGPSVSCSGREWFGDVQRKFSGVEIKGSSLLSSVIHRNLILDPVPYKTARLSRSQFSYAFQVSPGQKILRLHFNPAPYKGFKRYKDLFDVQSGPYTLLSNFSASLTAGALGVTSLVKEFCINIEENQLLNVVFSSANSHVGGTYAFINGVEVISVPASRSYLQLGDVGFHLIGKSLVYIDNSSAFEIVHQMNIKPDPLSSSTDDISDGFGMWETVPKQKGDKVNNVTWITSVDVGFRYLIRLHFSSLRFDMGETGGVVSNVWIDDKIADTNIDMDNERDDNSILQYRDYVVVLNGNKHDGKQDLLIRLESHDESVDGHGLLKGFEILKISNPDNSLASPNPLPVVNDPSCQILEILLKVVGHRHVIANVATMALVLINAIVYILQKVQEASRTEKGNLPSPKGVQLCRQFTLAELEFATRNFSDAHLIGKGGFGDVYKGLIDNGRETVAIKRLKFDSHQGAHEFLTEIETVTELRHMNLVSLIGYCNERKEMILVYEYMASGTLDDHLFKLVRNNDNVSPLTWKQRLNICIGAGRGLDYLHTGHSIVHRDVKASNILLDEDFTAKVSDFGLAKHLGVSKLQQSHVSTNVKGTFGYFDPEYFRTGKLTRKSDTYAFGVVLLEVLTGRRAFDHRREEDEEILVNWAQENISKGKADQIVAASLRGEISDASLKAFVDVAERCLHNAPNKRPTMAQVVLQLEFALEQQGSSQSSVSNEKSSEDVHYLSPPMSEQFIDSVTDVGHPSGRKDQRRVRVHKSLRRGSWGSFWNKVSFDNLRIPSKELVQKYKQIASTVISTEEMEDIKKSRDLKAFNQIAVPAIPVDELKDAFKSFDKNFFVSECIYHGNLRSGQTAAFKNLKPRRLGVQDFLALVSRVSSLKHANLVELLGYSMHDGLKVLVYEHASDGSLYDLLHVFEHIWGPVLSWTQRVKFAVGAAKGLEYLHEKGHVHGNVKSSNILLFGNAEVAKITNVDLPNPKLRTSTEQRASSGYHDPELINGKPTPKTDVWNFGVVLLELLTGRKPFDPTMPIGQEYLVPWATQCISQDKLNLFADARLKGQYPENTAVKMARVAALCLQTRPESRPNMSIVVKAVQPMLNTESSTRIQTPDLSLESQHVQKP